MSLISFTAITDGSTATASSVNTPLSTIYNDYNGNITDANVSASAAINANKLSFAANNTIPANALQTNAITLGYAQATTNQTGITTQVDLTSLSVTVTVPAGGRRVKITGYVNTANTVADAFNVVYIMEGATQLTTASADSRSGTFSQTVVPIWSGTPTAGSHTYKLQGQGNITGSGSMTVSAGTTSPSFILVEVI